MVFDECHHARKNHPYNGIMREYFQVPLHQRPKVFGMTASPIWNPKDAVGSLETLEKNMDATVIGVRAHLEELADHSPKPVEVSVQVTQILQIMLSQVALRSSQNTQLLQKNTTILRLRYGRVFIFSIIGPTWISHGPTSKCVIL
jgi:hypothetical protein